MIRIYTMLSLKKITFAGALFLTVLLFHSCGTTKPAPRPLPNRPGNTKPTPPVTPTKPPVNPPPGNNGQNQPGGQNGNNPSNNPTQSTYRIAVLLPFLTNQFTVADAGIPEKSNLAVQYYGGMQIGFATASEKGNYPNLVVDILDTQVSDAEFQQVMNTNTRLKQAQVIIGPIRNNHLAAMAEQIKTTRQVLISPESPSGDLTEKNPGFLQTNPSLRAHCSRIVQYLRSEKKRSADQVVLVCKAKESDRLPYFQEANAKLGSTALKEIIVPDASTNFDKVDFKKYMKAGQVTAFVMPSWAGQDWIVAFLSRLKQQKGTNKIEVFGMPQWADYEQIEPELLRDLNVHISSARYIDHTDTDVQAFERKFYELFGTIPDENAFKGYEVALLTANLLQKYGLSFPEKVTAASSFIGSLTGGYYFRRVQNAGAPMDTGTPALYDYIENIYVQILKFEQFQFRPPSE